VGPPQALVISLLCSAAIYCVFVFESAFHGELERLDPYWKFWGVKGVVSVTWMQWLIIRYGLCRSGNDWMAYFLYTTLCSVRGGSYGYNAIGLLSFFEIT
jgi:hypothetical protein